MKKIFNKLYLVTTLGIAAVMVISTSTQSMALSTASADKTSSAACTRITTLASTSDATVATHIASMKTDFANRLANIASRQADVDQQAATFRASMSDKFDSKITSLEQQANLTATQIAAIDTYSINMKAAESARETAVDTARVTYRTALSDVVNTHQQNLTTAVSAFETSTATAFTTAETNCGDGTALATLKQTISTARATLTSAQQSSPITNDITQLAQTRNTAIKAADTVFTNLAASYTATLESTLK